MSWGAALVPTNSTLLFITLELAPPFEFITLELALKHGCLSTMLCLQDKLHGFVEPFWIFVEDQDSERLLHHQYWVLKKS